MKSADRFLYSETSPSAAYEFLSLVVGDEIFDPALNEIRGAIRGSSDRGDSWEVELLRSAYAPVHQMRLWVDEDDHVAVDVVLFGWNVYRVHFLDIGLSPMTIGYELDLTTGLDYFVTEPESPSAG